jgi:two-component system chemotaxis response regulator CheB
VAEASTVASDPAQRDRAVVVAGASAGGVEALLELVRSLPPDFPLAVLVVLHVSPMGTSLLPAILSRACALPVFTPADGEPLQRGHVYVAPPDQHLVVEDSSLRLSQSPRENGHRPAIDPTMRTAAAAYDGATIGIVLSGSRDDGTAGLLAIKARGGCAIVQDPGEALYPSMPLNAMAHVEVDAVLPIAAMADWIMRRTTQDDPPLESEAAMSSDETVGARDDATTDTLNDPPRAATGQGTRFTCPDCGGVLFERHEGALERFECSVGHVFSIESLSNAQAEALETALWAAVRSLEDRAALLQRLARRARGNGQERSADTFEIQADEAIDRARTIREAIERSASQSPATTSEP